MFTLEEFIVEVGRALDMHGISHMENHFYMRTINTRKLHGKCRYNGTDARGRLSFRIQLSTAVYNKMGHKFMLGTLRHELAHAVEKILYGKMGHSHRFKLICRRLGGTMAPSVAGKEFADCIMSDDSYEAMSNWRYTCDCGQVFHRIRKWSDQFRAEHSCGKCKQDLVFAKVEDLRQ